MNPVSRATVYCTACQAFGVLPQGGVCPTCEGTGEFPRLAVPIKIVAAVDLSPIPDMSFRRMAVLLTEYSADGRVVLRGVTDGGIGLVASMSAIRFAEIVQVEFVESSLGWAS
jgi:hypothetical protein